MLIRIKFIPGYASNGYMYEQPNGNQQDAFYGGPQEGHIGDEMNGQYNYRSQVRISAFVLLESQSSKLTKKRIS